MGNRRYDQRSASDRPGFVLPSPEIMTKIIQGNDTDLLVNQAEDFGKELANRKLTTNQIRAFFGQVKQIELSVNRENRKLEEPLDDSDRRKLILLKPKLAYQAKRHTSVKPLEQVLSSAIDLIKNRKHFVNFVDFFEAILAYHKAEGGRDQ